MVLGFAPHVVRIDLVARQDGDGANELPTGVEHEQLRPLRLHHMLEPFAEKLPAVLPAADVLVGRRRLLRN